MMEDFEKEVVDLISTKSKLKRDVFELSKERFAELKSELKNLIQTWSVEIAKVDERLEMRYEDLGPYFAQVTIAGDTLVFSLHTNVFCFPAENPLWDTSYLKANPDRGYCGIIKVYNFLADSIRFNRDKDLGYLVARLFVNSENHFFVEGKKELGLLFNDFMHAELSAEQSRSFLVAVIRHCLKFDLYVPNYNQVARISVEDANTLRDSISLRTGKRLGFQFGMEEEPPE